MIGLDSSLKSGTRTTKTANLRLAPPGILPTHEQIALRAYDIYVNNGYLPDHSEDNWLQAERELLEETLDAEV